MAGKHERGVARVLSTVCIGATLVVGGWSPSATVASTAADTSGASTANGPMFLRASRNRPSPGDQFGLSKAEQDYIYGPRDIGTSHVPGLHSPRGPLAS